MATRGKVSTTSPSPLAGEGRGWGTAERLSGEEYPPPSRAPRGPLPPPQGGRGRATAQVLADGRLHLNHGPIDLVIEAWGGADEVRGAYAQAWAVFPDILPRLVEELSLLRRAVDETHPGVDGPVARRMLEACRQMLSLPRVRGRVGEEAIPIERRSSLPVPPLQAGEGETTVFLTPMAAVAGAVADHVLAAMLNGRTLTKAYVNDGGDIALHVSRGETLRAGIVADIRHPALDSIATITAESPVRGIATSGAGGRSFSRGIADAVTVLAASGAAADAAATLIANAADIDDAAVRRAPASSIDPDSDLGERLVTLEVGPLDGGKIATALDRGASEARRFLDAGLIHAAVLLLRGENRVVA
jgi:ApbE superfamily uncharacterized protein (UPF0280 family)